METGKQMRQAMPAGWSFAPREERARGKERGRGRRREAAVCTAAGACLRAHPCLRLVVVRASEWGGRGSGRQ